MLRDLGFISTDEFNNIGAHFYTQPTEQPTVVPVDISGILTTTDSPLKSEDDPHENGTD